MGAAKKLELISEEDYLAGELISEVKHEYLGGTVHAMAGARMGHNAIASNILGILHQRLKGKPCRPFNSDTKVRIKLATRVRYYYPDVMVICGAYSREESFHAAPAVIVEVTSKSTRRIDHGEKRDAYLTLPSLEAYVIVESGERKVTVWRRGEAGFSADVYSGGGAVVELAGPDIELPLDDVYESVTFPPVSADEEAD